LDAVTDGKKSLLLDGTKKGLFPFTSTNSKRLKLGGTGKSFGSPDEIDSWRLLADNLPSVYSVSTATI
jgi:hypothetical protein